MRTHNDKDMTMMLEKGKYKLRSGDIRDVC